MDCDICDGSGILQIVSCKGFFDLDWEEAKYIVACHACQNGDTWAEVMKGLE